MLHELLIHHKKRPALLEPVSKEGLLYWQTCLRSLYIGHKDNMPQACGADVYEAEAAYSFLLKIICGLDSFLVGETEVFGQFRSRVDQLKDFGGYYEAYLLRILTQLICDAKNVRELHLTGLGSQSYGSWLRNRIGEDTSPVHIIGCGHLCKEILPWFDKLENQVFVYARSLEKARQALREFNRSISLRPIESLFKLSLQEGFCIIAAPISESFLGSLDQETFGTIFDLRGESSTDPLKVSENQNYIRLEQIFLEVDKNKQRLGLVVSRATEEIARKTQQRLDFSQARPFGWDDLPA